MNPTCPECGQTYGPHGGGHCRGGQYGGCCHTFTSDSAFDAHRTGPYSARSCLDVEAVEGWRRTRHGWTNSLPFASIGVSR